MKSNKIYIVATICLLLGLGVFITGFTLLDFDIQKLSSDTPFEEKNFVSSKTIHAISIKESNLNISILPSMDDKIHVTYYENDTTQYEITESDSGDFAIKKEISRKWYQNFFTFQWEQPSLQVWIPSAFSGDIEVENYNGAIGMNNIGADNLKITTSNDKIDISNVTIASNVEVTTYNGEILFEQVDVKGTIRGKTANDSVELSNVQCESLHLENYNGKLSVIEVVAQKEIGLKTGNDDIVLENLTFGTELNCNNYNGTVEGSITGKMSDYSIDCSVYNGDCNLPEKMDGGKKWIEIQTTNDDISIDFS